jgi:hypothetical protein
MQANAHSTHLSDKAFEHRHAHAYRSAKSEAAQPPSPPVVRPERCVELYRKAGRY